MGAAPEKGQEHVGEHRQPPAAHVQAPEEQGQEAAAGGGEESAHQPGEHDPAEQALADRRAEGGGGSGLDKKSRALLPGEAPQKGIGSLNKNARIQIQQKIQRENQDILKRIQEQGNKKSIFDIKSLEEDWQKTLSYRRLASNWNVPTSKKKKAKAPPGEEAEAAAEA